MTLKSHLAFGHERRRDIRLGIAIFTKCLPALECLGLRQAETEENDQHRRTGAEPEERPPAMRGRIDEATRKGRRKQIPEGVTLLEHTGDDTAGRFGAVLEGSCGGITVQTTHGDSEQSTAGQELPVGLTESSSKLKSDEQDVVDDKRPFATPLVRSDTENDGAD